MEVGCKDASHGFKTPLVGGISRFSRCPFIVAFFILSGKAGAE